MEIDPTQQYDAPVVFGPSRFPDVTAMGSVRSVSIAFVTDDAAMAKLLPPFLEPADLPVVTVGHTMNRDVDYMGSRGYNIVRVAFSAVHRGSGETIVAPYAPVIWENDAAPIILGRERGGYAKLFGTIPDRVEHEGGCTFSLHEYDVPLLHARVDGLRQTTERELAEIRAATSDAVSFGWKYIPGSGAAPDADYGVLLRAQYDYSAAWRGEGTVTFDTAGAAAAPYSGHIIAALAALPVLEARPATMVEGSMKLPRTEVRRLDGSGS